MLKRDWGDVLHVLAGQCIVLPSSLLLPPAGAWLVACLNFMFWPIREGMQRAAKGEDKWSWTNHREAWPSGILGFASLHYEAGEKIWALML